MSDLTGRLSAALADRYRIERELGAGGMATVYLAEDLRHHRRVAVKVLKPELAAVIGGDRFLAEIKTTANLQHPHILALFDSGQVEGTVFYVMPYVEGESLRDRLNREKQLPIADALGIAREVADALHYAHGHGVIHRDIKPENILLHGGHALVADFGIALAASSTAGARMTETGMSLGTPTYMSPEQAMGEREITARSDVYALGCVVYEMLLGEPPFTGPTAQSIVAKVISEKPTPLRSRRDRVPVAVEVAVLTALEKLPADRYATLAEFSAALTAQVTETSQAIPAMGARGVGARGMDWRLVFLGGLLAGVAVATSIPWGRAAGGNAATVTSQQLTFNGRSRLPAISPDGEFVAFVDQRCPIYAERTCPQTLVVQERQNARPVAILRDAAAIGTPRWSADGREVIVPAVLDADRRGLYAVPRLGGVPRQIGPPDLFDTHATLDSVVVASRDRTTGMQVARVRSIATGEAGDSVLLGRRAVNAIAWSGDGSLIAVVASYSQLTIHRRDGTVADSIPGAFRDHVRGTPDGGGFLLFRALAVKEDNLERIEVGTDGRIIGRPRVVLPKVSTLLRGEFDVARPNGRLAFVTGVLNLDLWTFDLGAAANARQRTSGTTWYGSPGISPGGDRLYYLRGDAMGDNLYALILPDSEEALRADTFPGGFSDVRVSNDGRRVIFGASVSEGYRLGELDASSRQARFMPWSSGLSSVAPVPIGARELLYAPPGGRELVVVDSIGGSRRSIAAPDSVQIHLFAPSPDGREAALLVTSGGTRMIGITSLTEWRWRDVARRDVPLRIADMWWTADGSIYYVTPPLDERPAQLHRILKDATRSSLVMVLPSGCHATGTTIAFVVSRGACLRTEARADIWFADVPGIRP